MYIFFLFTSLPLESRQYLNVTLCEKRRTKLKKKFREILYFKEIIIFLSNLKLSWGKSESIHLPEYLYINNMFSAGISTQEIPLKKLFHTPISHKLYTGWLSWQWTFLKIVYCTKNCLILQHGKSPSLLLAVF